MTESLKTGPLDQFERTVRVLLGVALVLLAWGFGWSDVEAIGALVLGIVALATAAVGYSPADRMIARLSR
jgi:glucose-6-phosphate-specific signal transduction histidine kinase